MRALDRNSKQPKAQNGSVPTIISLGIPVVALGALILGAMKGLGLPIPGL